ncbi:membrane protein insertion efficiency factor YidD [Puniceicoccus vermicola]|uniref:Putative membrane protein insertion efficiency factor n=1 Tax=Puniceicoccus vermicola TaxID=388746 RepID=A0A7X1B3T0_9BACT|nr:membrane protein insertion efficiency factor YidD [Puniceicoccus vermicola]MBC2603885.1 membrane protein insertion efficiency factor YidD [Puniceicoccus vermicola]
MAFLLRCLIGFYRVVLTPVRAMFGMHATCRYVPTCSEYADEAVRVHGAWKGGWLAICRICRCHPWGGHGWDPVPEADLGEKKADEEKAK